MQNTPYPARRRYVWAMDHMAMPYQKALAFFKQMQRQCPKEKNPQRHAALGLMVECINELNHKGVEDFAGPKLHRLLIKCADTCGWHTDANAIQRSLVPRLVEGTKDIYTCPKCGKDKPRADFMGLMSMAQKEKYNKPEGTRALVMQKRCANCRYNAHEAKKRRSVRVKKRTVISQWATTMATTKDVSQGDVYLRYGIEVRRKQTNVRHALLKLKNPEPNHQPRKDFYEYIDTLLMLCIERLEERLNFAHLADLKKDKPSWLHLLSTDERADAVSRFAQLRRAESAHGLRGRGPSLL
jgi:hypothetical protein